MSKAKGNLILGSMLVGLACWGVTQAHPVVLWIRGILDITAGVLAAALVAGLLTGLLWLGLMGVLASVSASDRLLRLMTWMSGLFGFAAFWVLLAH